MEQPKPTPGKESVTEAVIADLRQREQKGIVTYGRSLETFNGRNALRDAYEECLDLAQYLKQKMMENDDMARELALLRPVGAAMLALGDWVDARRYPRLGAAVSALRSSGWQPPLEQERTL